MIDAFAGVGVPAFNLTRIDINRQTVPEGYRPGRNILAMRRLLLPAWIPLSWELEQNLIVRPLEPACGVIAQLDDLKASDVDRVREKAFLIVETSPGNFQVWIAIVDGDGALVKRLMTGIGSDTRASCSGRIAGSPNVKRKYAPDFPMVRIVALQPGRRVTRAELESLGLLAPQLITRSPASSQFRGSTAPRGWPDYDRCLRGAPPSLVRGGLPDRSRADLLWCKWALERRNSPDAVRAQLIEISEKAREEVRRRNNKYVKKTVDLAIRAARLEAD
jgi:hypothetical protein